MAMSVSIQKYPVSLVVKNILTDRFSGELVIKSKDLNKSLHFQDGDLVFASSDVFDERIGVILYLLGKLNDQQYEYIRKLVSCNDLEIGNILVQNRFVTRDDLFYTTLFQMKKAAINAFKISRGEWEMISQEPVFELDPKQRIQLPPIIAEGARKIEDISFFLNKIQFLVPRTTRIPEPLKILLSGEEVALYHRLEDCKSMTNREIISKLNLDPQLYWKNLVLFILLDLIDFSRPRQKIDVEDNIRRLLEFQTKLRQGNLDSFGILGVSPHDPKSKAKLAFLRLSRQFHPDRFGSAAAPEIKKIAGLVYDQIETAYKDLKKQYKKKRKEDRMIADSVNELVCQPEADELFEIELDESGEAEIPESQESVEAEIAESLKSDEVKAPKSWPSTGKDVSEPSIISMKEEMKEIAKAGTLPTGDIPVVSGERKKVPDIAPQGDMNILESAEELYMEKKYHDACGILKAALKKYPDKGEYHYLLGLCQTHMEFFQEEAERHLKKAVELNPWNSDPVYALGILFRIQGKTRQAASCFERVMKISKDHGKAVKAMRELSKKTRKRSTLFHFLKKDNKDL
jgi:tetratricopeptide (TPR) repeat protein